MPRPTLIAVALAGPLLAATLGACGNTQGGTPVANAAGPDDMPMPDGSRADVASVKLYPGSVMRKSAKIMPHETDDMMHYSFVSPAAPDVVRTWFAAELKRDGYTVKDEGGSLVGTDAGGHPFRLDLTDAPGGRAMGVISKG